MRQRGLLLGGEEGRAQRRVADVTAGHLVAPRQVAEIERACDRQLLGQVDAPEPFARLGIGKWQGQATCQAALEGRVDRGAEVGGQDGDALERIEPLQEIVDLEIGVAVGRGSHLRALAEQRVGLVEQDHRLALFGRVEHPGEVLLGLSDPLRHHAREIHAVEIEAELVGERTGKQRLAGARAALEQHGEATGRRHHLVEPPGIVDRLPVPDPGDQLGDAVPDGGRQDDLRPAGEPGHPRRDVAKPGLEVLSQRGLDRTVLVRRGRARHGRHHAADDAGADGEPRGQLVGPGGGEPRLGRELAPLRGALGDRRDRQVDHHITGIERRLHVTREAHGERPMMPPE